MPSFNFTQLSHVFACHFTIEEHLELGRIVDRIVKMIKRLVTKTNVFLHTEHPEHLNNIYDLFQQLVSHYFISLAAFITND